MDPFISFWYFQSIDNNIEISSRWNASCDRFITFTNQHLFYEGFVRKLKQKWNYIPIQIACKIKTTPYQNTKQHMHMVDVHPQHDL